MNNFSFALVLNHTGSGDDGGNDGVSFTNMIYIISGALAIIGNTLLIVVLVSRLEYFKRSAFLFGLALCDILHGAAIMVSAVLRTEYQSLPSSLSQVRPTYCILTISSFWIIGNQGTALMLLLIGTERFVAVQFFAWYRVNWTRKLSWLGMSMVLVFCLFSISVAYYIASTATGVSILAGFGANTGTVLSLILCLIKLNRFRRYPGNNSNATMQSHIKKQWHLSKTMIGCTVCDFGLVVIPNILMFMISSFNINAAAYGLQNVTTYAPPLLCIKGFLNLFCCLLFNPEFRRNVLYLTKLKKNTSVVPINMTAANSCQENIPLPKIKHYLK